MKDFLDLDNLKIGLCYYPTTVVAVDDHPGLLRNLVISLGENVPMKTFNKPLEALEFLNHHPIYPFYLGLLESEDFEGDQYGYFSGKVDVRAIDQRVYFDDRYGEISVVLVDYAMPEIDGLSFCRQLKRAGKRVILLTGEAGHELAVEAFNEKLIDQFILKGAANCSLVLEKAIEDQQRAYFLEASKIILRSLPVQSAIVTQLLMEPAFVKLFDDLCREHQFVEYYLIDDEGGFLFLDGEGSPSILVLKNAENLDDYYDIAINAEGVEESILSALRNHTHVPLFYLGNDLKTPPNQWGPYLHAAKTLIGEYDRYYYALLPSAEKYGVKKAEINSFFKYLDATRDTVEGN